METFSLGGRPHITLTNLLKICGWCDSGGSAKHAIEEGQVSVDGQIELRKKCKLNAGQIVTFADQQVQISE